MNKKIMTSALMVIMVPTSILAAQIPVTQENGGTTPREVAPTSTTVARAISTTASPATNKAIRTEAENALRESVQVVAPEAQTFMNRLAISVRPVTLKANYLDLTYPEVQSVSPVVTEKINKTIRNYVNGFEQSILKDNVKAENKTNATLTYDVQADGNGIFSVLLKSYTMQDRAANGANYVKSFTFNTSTGKLISLGDLGGLSLTQVNQVIQNLPAESKTALFENAKAERLPGEFYVAENHDVTLVFQEGILGPTSSGTIYLPMGQLKVK